MKKSFLVKKSPLVAIMIVAVAITAIISSRSHKEDSALASDSKVKQSSKKEEPRLAHRVNQSEKKASARKKTAIDETKVQASASNDALHKIHKDRVNRSRLAFIRKNNFKKKAAELGIQKLTNQLNLNGAQEKALRDYMNEKDSIVNAYRNGDLSQEEFAATLKDEHLASSLEEHLSEEQQQDLLEYQQNELENKIDTSALKQLSELQAELSLSPEQRDTLYTKLLNELTQETNSKSDAEIIQDHLRSLTNPDAAIPRKLEGDPATLREKQIESMRPILDDLQLEQYRNYLESKA